MLTRNFVTKYCANVKHFDDKLYIVNVSISLSSSLLIRHLLTSSDHYIEIMANVGEVQVDVMDIRFDDSETDEMENDINALIRVNPVNRGYYVAMYLQRIIAR